MKKKLFVALVLALCLSIPAFAAAPLPGELYQEDGMHPSAAGSRVMADAVLQSLAARNM